MHDILIAKTAVSLDGLPAGATIATGSVRRRYQLRAIRPDLQLADLRGNVPTRLRRLTQSGWDGIILARAGLERLGLQVSREQFDFEGQTLRSTVLPRDNFVPAGGQGIIALQVRAGDEGTKATVIEINDDQTLACLRAEREFLRLLQGDCGTPVGVLATIAEGKMTIHAQVFYEGIIAPRVAELRQSLENRMPESVGAQLMEMINGR